MHISHLGRDLVARCVLSQVENRRLATWRQDAVDLVERADRNAEVLERRHADHEVERRVGKRHPGRVTVAEIDRDTASRAFARAIRTNDSLISSPVTL